MSTALRTLLVFAGLFGAAMALAADPFVIKVRRVWEGLASGPLRTPYIVQIANNTDEDASGELSITSGQDQMVIPVDLGRRSNKEIPIYPKVEFDSILLDYRSNAGNARLRLNPPGDYVNFRIGSIGDTSGLLTFLKIRRTNRGEVISDPQLSLGHCSPEEAPDRAAGYVSLDAVFLVEGAERLNPRQVGAIKQYVLQGGRLIIPGGANAPVLSSEAWQNVLPIRNAAPRNLSAGTTITGPNAVRYRLTEATTAMLGEPAPGTFAPLKVDGQPLAVIRPIGLGSIVFLGIHPFVEPMDAHPNRRQMVMDALRSARYGASSFRVHRAALASRYGSEEYAYTPTRPMIQQEPVSQGLEDLYPHKSGQLPSTSDGENPFDVKLIPARTIGLVFGAFFFVVLPLNFLVLRLLKKMELAWVTTPICSLAFAGLLLTFAQGLYRAQLSRSYNGFIVQDIESGEAAQWLKAEIFLPKGGTYDLTLPNSDQVLSHADFLDDYNYGYYDSASQGYRVVDTGEMSLPQVDVPNLAFRELIYHRTQTEPLKLTMRLTDRGGRITGQVTNGTDYNLVRVAVLYRGRYWYLPDLKPGASATLPETVDVSSESTPALSSGRFTGQAVLLGVTSDFDPGGPGKLAKANTRVLVVSVQSVEVRP